MFIYMQKSTSSLTSFLRYCKDIVNLLFWELWECLTIPIKIIVSICSKLLCLSACKKINFFTHFFLKIMQRNSKLVILGNLSMPGHAPKMIVSIWGNIWHLSAGKKSASSFTFSLSFFLLRRYFKLVLGTLDMLCYAHPKWYNQFIENFCVYLQVQKISFIPHAFLKIGWQHFDP